MRTRQMMMMMAAKPDGALVVAGAAAAHRRLPPTPAGFRAGRLRPRSGGATRARTASRRRLPGLGTAFFWAVQLVPGFFVASVVAQVAGAEGGAPGMLLGRRPSLTLVLVCLGGMAAAVAVHEGGHWLALWRLGRPARVIVGPLCGFTRPRDDREIPAFVALAVPAASIAAGLCAHAAAPLLPPVVASAARLLGDWSVWILGAAMLVPAIPLDGGHATAALLRRLPPRRHALVSSGHAALGAALFAAFAVTTALRAGLNLPTMLWDIPVLTCLTAAAAIPAATTYRTAKTHGDQQYALRWILLGTSLGTTAGTALAAAIGGAP